jgi:uncharacterized membrane protein
MRVVLYTRPECHLCEEVRLALGRMQREHPHQLVEVDIESEPALHQKYAESIPVVLVGPYTLRAPISDTDLRVTLAAAEAGAQSKPPRSSFERRMVLGVNRAILSFTRHWLLVFNLAVLLFVGIPFLAPVLMKTGATGPARAIYRVYSPLCHQLAFRSWFLFGEQAAYPRKVAGLPVTSYGEATGLDEGDYLAAKRFLGNEQVGYKVAFCQRDIAIYVGILAAGMGFALVRHRLRPPSMWLWVLVGIVPLALDGFSQLVSAFPGYPFGVRESTPLLRTLTGLLFGISCVWLAYPHAEEAMAEARGELVTKLSGREHEVPSAPAGPGVVD